MSEESMTKTKEAPEAEAFEPSERVLRVPVDCVAILDDVREGGEAGGTGGKNADTFGDIVSSVARDPRALEIIVRRNTEATAPEGGWGAWVRPEGPAFIVLDGRRRLLAAIEAGLSEIEVRIDEPVSWRRKALLLNVQRLDMSPWEEAKQIAVLKREERLKQKDIAATLGKSEAWVSRRLKLIALVEEGKFTEQQAKALSQSDLQNLVKEEGKEKRKREGKGEDEEKRKLKPAERVDRAARHVYKAIEYLDGLRSYKQFVADLTKVNNALMGEGEGE